MAKSGAAEVTFVSLTHLYQCRWLPEFGVDLHSNTNFVKLSPSTFRLAASNRDFYHLLNDACRIRPDTVQLVDETYPGN